MAAKKTTDTTADAAVAEDVLAPAAETVNPDLYLEFQKQAARSKILLKEIANREYNGLAVQTTEGGFGQLRARFSMQMTLTLQGDLYYAIPVLALRNLD